MPGRTAADRATAEVGPTGEQTPGRWQRLSHAAGDAHIGQTILRLAGLAEAVHRMEHVRGQLAAEGLSVASLAETKDSGLRQVVIAPAGVGLVRKDADAGRSSQPRTEVGR